MAARAQNKSRQLPHVRPKLVDTDAVTTPWFPDGIALSEVTLDGEIAAAVQLLTLFSSERAARDDLTAAVAAAARSQWGSGATVVTYGSYAVGLSAPTSAIDLTVARCGSGRVTHKRVLEALSLPGLEVVCATCSDGQGFVQLKGSKVRVNITVREGGADAELQSVAIVRAMLAEFPHAAAAHCVLRQILQQSGTLDVTTGGMSAYALLVMLVNVLRRCPAEARSPAAAVLAFCRAHGAQAGDAGALQAASPTGSGDLLAGCRKSHAIRYQLQHCFYSFLRWSETTAAGRRSDASAADRDSAAAYRGRTALSSVLSHQVLWPRRDALRREMRQAQRQNMQRRGRGQRGRKDRGAAGATATSPQHSFSSEPCGLSDSPQSSAVSVPQILSQASLDTLDALALSPFRWREAGSSTPPAVCASEDDCELELEDLPPQLLELLDDDDDERTL